MVAAGMTDDQGPFIMGRTFDTLGSYGPALYGFEAAMVATLLMLVYLPAYVYAPDGTLLRRGSINGGSAGSMAQTAARASSCQLPAYEVPCRC